MPRKRTRPLVYTAPFPAKGGRHGALSPVWRGDHGARTTNYTRAQRAFPLGPCGFCGGPGFDRHHWDLNPGNNTVENVIVLCRSCHGVLHHRGYV